MVEEPNTEQSSGSAGPEDGSGPDGGAVPGGGVVASFYDVMNSGTLLLLFTACLLSNYLFQAIFWGGRPGSAIWGLALAPVLGILVPMVLLLRRLRRSPRIELWLFGLSGPQVLGVVLAIAGAIPLVYVLGVANAALVPPDAQALDLQKSLIPVDTPSLAGGIAAIVVVAPLGEEVLFRALLLGTLARHVRPLPAVILVGILFGLTHNAPWVTLPLAFLGVLLGLLVLLTRTLTAAWLGHALFNLAGYVELAWTRDVETQALAQWSLQPVVLIAAAVVLALALWFLRGRAMAEADTTVA